MLETNDFILGFVDREIVDELIHHLRDCNIHVLLNEQINAINKFDDGKVVCKFKSGKSMAVDTVLFAPGDRGLPTTWRSKRSASRPISVAGSP